MITVAITHFVLVDFENVPEVDLGLVRGKPVQITLLIGKNQGKLDYTLVEQIHRLAAQVELVKLDASGRNALDLTLAYYLGQAVARAPGAQFCIVSRDKDFEPMIAHLISKHLRVVRCDSFAALPFLPKPRRSSPAKHAVPARVSEPARAGTMIIAGSPPERLEKLATRLSNNLAPRPKKKSSLLAHLNTVFGGRLSEAEQNQNLAELIKRRILSIDSKDKVTYPAVQPGRESGA